MKRLDHIRECAEKYKDEPQCKCPDPLHSQGDAARLVLEMADELERLQNELDRLNERIEEFSSNYTVDSPVLVENFLRDVRD